LLCAGIGVGILGTRLLAPTATIATPVEVAPTEDSNAKPKRRLADVHDGVALASSIPPSTPSAAPNEESVPSREATELAFREQQATVLVDNLVGRLNALGRSLGEENPEALVAQVSGYSMGAVDALLRVSPEVTGQVSEQIEQRLCDANAKDTELLLLTQIAGGTTGVASSAGVDCVLKRRSKEDLVVWSTLDAWRASGLPKTEAIAELESRAIDKRTLGRLKPQQEALSEL
jgi:hypothetical protein